MKTKKIKQNLAALSLIEVLIAIVIFAVGILAILQMIITTMTTVDKVRLQTDATMLSSQGIEVVRSLRNTNIMKGLPWDCAESGLVEEGLLQEECQLKFLEEGHALRLAMQHEGVGDASPYTTIESKELPETREEIFKQFQLFAHTGTLEGSDTVLTWFDHNPEGGIPTFYARYIQFNSVDSQLEGVEEGSEDYVLGVQSVVLIQKGSYQGQVVMESLMGKIYE